MDTQALADYLDTLLRPGDFRDYCPNGLQLEGAARVRSLVTGVTASLALIEAAIEHGADTLLVHHGLFWRSDPGVLTGWRRRRVAELLAADVNVFAYHLPLDAHPELGNNAQLGARLGIARSGSLDAAGLVALGELAEPLEAGVFAARVAGSLGREPLLAGDRERVVRRVAWCTGAGQSFIEQAVGRADVFLTGEASEQTVHVAREAGITLLAAGHHATERYGVQALGEHLARRFGLAHRFVDIDNPV